MNVEEKRIRKTMINTTLPKLNKLSAAQNCLVLLRTLNTSDLTFHYMLYTPDTIRDIAKVARAFLNSEEPCLTTGELEEYIGYITDLETYYA